MRRRILIGLLALGALGGFAAGFARLCAHRHGGWHGRHEAFERRVADVCAEAALRATSGERRRP
jgi:hypothetical protein